MCVVNHRCTPPLIAAILILAPAAASAQPGMDAPPVVAARVEQRQVQASQSFVGSVLPVRRATIGSAVSGRVIEAPFEEGDRVEASQKLAQMLTETISLEIAEAEGELMLRQQQLAELENGTRPEEVRQTAAQKEAAKARREFLFARRERLQKLFNQRNAVTEDELQEAVANAAEAEQLFLEAEAAHELSVAGPRKEVVEQARAQVQIQQAVVERLRDQRKKYTVSSKFDAYVVAKHTEEGAWLNQGDPVAEVVSIDPVEVVVQVGEQSLPFIQPGGKVQVVFPSLYRRLFEGEVYSVVPQGDLRSRTFPVKVRLDNELTPAGPLFRPGMYSRVTLPIGGEVTATMAPKDSLILGNQMPLMYLVDGATKPGQKAQVRPVSVEVGIAQDGQIQITGPVKAGDLAIVRGNERLRPGQEVIITEIIEGSNQPEASPPQASSR